MALNVKKGDNVLIIAGKDKGKTGNVLVAMPADTDIVLIHDAARPLITESVVLQLIKAANKFGAAACGVFAVDTLKLVEP